ncbi:hypothetical protein MRY82_03375 [bacterium]|nr:hypothetical protein [bacterium]
MMKKHMFILSMGFLAILVGLANTGFANEAKKTAVKAEDHYFKSLLGEWTCKSDEEVNKLGKIQNEKNYVDHMIIDYDLEKSWVSMRYNNQDIYQNQCYYDYVANEETYRQICLSSKHAWSMAMGKEMGQEELTFKGKVYHQDRPLTVYKTFLKTNKGLQVYSKIKDPKKLLSKTWSAQCKKDPKKIPQPPKPRDGRVCCLKP